jgi:hypothetical protein
VLFPAPIFPSSVTRIGFILYSIEARYLEVPTGMRLSVLFVGSARLIPVAL